MALYWQGKAPLSGPAVEQAKESFQKQFEKRVGIRLDPWVVHNDEGNDVRLPGESVSAAYEVKTYKSS